MKVKTILFLCLATTVAIWAVTEVQELGNNDAHDDSHESANLDAGDDHVDDDHDSIGEDMGVGRRGGFLSTTGSFQLSSGGGRGPRTTGPTEEDEDIYFPRSKYQGNIDGAYYGTTFPHLFLMTYGYLKPQKGSVTYTPRIFGFKS